jgi:phage gp16-like protein
MNRRTDYADKARRRVLGAIHALAKECLMEDDAYRCLVARVSAQHGPEQRSAGKCTPKQLDAIANELRRIAGKPAQDAQNARRRAGKPKGDLTAQMGKVEALLADAGREWAYAHALAKRLCKVERVDWCNPDQLAKVIAALQIDADRRARKTANG